MGSLVSRTLARGHVLHPHPAAAAPDEGTAGSYPVARGRHDRRHELGIHGAIAEVEDKVIWLEVAPEVELKISKGAVAEIVTDEDDDENDDEGADDLAAGDADA